MSVRNVVKVMNFHALLRVNDARKKVEKAFNYERELKYVIATIVNNTNKFFSSALFFFHF